MKPDSSDIQEPLPRAGSSTLEVTGPVASDPSQEISLFHYEWLVILLRLRVQASLLQEEELLDLAS